MQNTVIFQSCENDNFQMKNCHIFLIFVPNMDSGNTLEPTHNLCFREKKKIIHTPVYPSFTI